MLNRWVPTQTLSGSSLMCALSCLCLIHIMVEGEGDEETTMERGGGGQYDNGEYNDIA